LPTPTPNRRPQGFTREVAGCEVVFRFLTVKLMDLDEQDLEQSANPFALVVGVHLRALNWCTRWRIVGILWRM